MKLSLFHCTLYALALALVCSGSARVLNTFGSYGHANHKKLQEASRKYDPKGLFQYTLIETEIT